MFWRSKKDKSKERDKSKRKSRDSADADRRSAVPTNRHEIEAVLANCVATAQAASGVLRAVKDADVEEFMFTLDVVVNALAKIQHAMQPTWGLQQMLLQLSSTLDAFARALQTSKLSNMLSSSRRRPALAQQNQRIQTELRLALDASGITFDTVGETPSDEALRQRLLDSFTSEDARKLWESLFDQVEVDMIQWDTFIEAYQKAVSVKLDTDDESLLKYVLDNDSLGGVSARSFNTFLKIFGPLEKSLANIKSLFKQRWFHGFLSVEEVIRLLMDQPAGTFLVRFSRTKPDSFVLEYVETKGKIRTVMIKNDMPHGVRIMEEANMEKLFPTINSLIENYGNLLTTPFLSDFLSQPWFYGDISMDEATEMLHGRPVGTFMIRFSALGHHAYAASFVARNTATGADPASTVVKHVNIFKVPSGYVIGSDSAGSSASTASKGSLASTSSSSSSSTSSGSHHHHHHHHHKPKHGIEDEKGTTVYASLTKLIAEWRHVLTYNYSTQRVSTIKLADYAEAPQAVDFVGPLMTDGVGFKAEHGPGGSLVYAENAVTYPKDTYPYQIVCDQFNVRVLGNRVVFALADGCGWGRNSRDAAIVAAQTIIDRVATRACQTSLQDTTDIRRVLLRAFSHAHDAIVASQEFPGTTTLIAGMVVELEPQAASDEPEYAVVAVSVGDCKAYVWSQKDQVIIDMTSGNRTNLRDAKDPGGRLGPYINGGPDLRNLASFFWPLAPGDVIFAVSDGIHDNVEPEACGLTPAQVGERLKSNPLVPAKVLQTAADAGDSWDKVPEDMMEDMKVMYQTHRLKQLIQSSAGVDASSAASACVRNALAVTNNSRNFMEKNPTLPEPSDHVAYPGKMDHATIVSIQAAAYFPRSSLKVYKPSATSVAAMAAVTSAASGLGALGSGALAANLTAASSSSSSSASSSSSSSSSSSNDKVSKKSSSADSNKVPAGPCEALADKLLLNTPTTAIADYATSQSFLLLKGPAQANDGEAKLVSMASGWTTSTYPVVKLPDGTRGKMGDPNSNIFTVELTPNRITLALTVGGFWGRLSLDGSSLANQTFIDAISRIQPEIKTVAQAKLGCLRAFDAAHKSLVESTGREAPLHASLLAAMLLRSKDTSNGKWVMLVSTIGSSKLFVWRKADQTVRDVTRASTPADRADSGGRLGDYKESGAPDLRNLTMYSTEVEDGDIVFALSPGAHQNFEPDILGESPQDLPEFEDDSKATWVSLLKSNPSLLVEAKDNYRCSQISDLLCEFEADEIDASKVTQTIVSYCIEKTKKTRQFMEADPYAKEPSDYVKYPGKVGHATCLAVKVGQVPQSDMKQNALLPTMFQPLKNK